MYRLIAGKKMSLGELPAGSLFISPYGNIMFKSEYFYPNGQCKCMIYNSGEYTLEHKNETVVIELVLIDDDIVDDMLETLKAAKHIIENDTVHGSIMGTLASVVCRHIEELEEKLVQL